MLACNIKKILLFNWFREQTSVGSDKNYPIFKESGEKVKNSTNVLNEASNTKFSLKINVLTFTSNVFKKSNETVY